MTDKHEDDYEYHHDDVDEDDDRARELIAQEERAANEYEAMADDSDDRDAEAVFRDIAREEKVHAGELFLILLQKDPEEMHAHAEGMKEAAEITGMDEDVGKDIMDMSLRELFSMKRGEVLDKANGVSSFEKDGLNNHLTSEESKALEDTPVAVAKGRRRVLMQDHKIQADRNRFHHDDPSRKDPVDPGEQQWEESKAESRMISTGRAGQTDSDAEVRSRKRLGNHFQVKNNNMSSTPRNDALARAAQRESEQNALEGDASYQFDRLRNEHEQSADSVVGKTRRAMLAANQQAASMGLSTPTSPAQPVTRGNARYMLEERGIDPDAVL